MTRLVTRADRLDLGMLEPHRTGEGFAWFEARIARPGIYEYINADGSIRRELVPRETLHHPESLATLGGKPLTLQHPEDFVTPESVRDDGVGHVGSEIEVEAEGGFVRVRLMVQRRDALDAIGAGTVEVSPGYRAVVEDTPGTDPEFGDYDAVQVWRGPYNHLAIVDAARGGPEVRLRADAVQHNPERPWGAPLPPDPSPPSEPDMNRALLLALIAATAPRVDESDRAKLADALTPHLDGDDPKPAEGEDSGDELAKLRDENARLKAKIADMEKGTDAGDMPDDDDDERDDAAIHADRLTWARDRSQLERAATAAKLDLDDTEGNDALRRRIVEARVGEAVKDAADPVILAHWQILAAKRPEDTARADGWTVLFKDDTRTDADPAERADARRSLSVIDAAEAAQMDRLHGRAPESAA